MNPTLYDDPKMDPACCRGRIYTGSYINPWRQCASRKTTPFTMPDGTVVGFCGTHHPDARAKREAKRNAERLASDARNSQARRDATVRIGLAHAMDDELRAECERRGLVATHYRKPGEPVAVPEGFTFPTPDGMKP